METNIKGRTTEESPLHYDEVREVLNTPPPALIIKTNLLVITILVGILVVITFVKLPITYEPSMKFSKSSVQDFSQTIMYENDVEVIRKYTEDRAKVKKGDRLFTLNTPLGNTDVTSLYNGRIVFAKSLIKGMVIQKNTPIAWIKSLTQSKDTIRFYVSRNDINYFKINQQILLRDKENKKCKIVPIQFFLQKNRCQIVATASSQESNFDYNSAKFSIEIDQQTILEQLLNKKIFAQ